MDPSNAIKRDKLFQQLKKAIESQDQSVLDEFNGNEPTIVHFVFRHKDNKTKQNLLMISIINKNCNAISVILDRLHLHATAYKLWNTENYASFLLEKDDNQENVFQHALRANSDTQDNWAVTTILQQMKVLNKQRVLELLMDKCGEGLNAFHQAVVLKYDHRMLSQLFDAVTDPNEDPSTNLGTILCERDEIVQNTILHEAINQDKNEAMIQILAEKVGQIRLDKTFVAAICNPNKRGESALRTAIKLKEKSYFSLLIKQIIQREVWSEIFTSAILDAILESDHLHPMGDLCRNASFKNFFLEHHIKVRATDNEGDESVSKQVQEFLRERSIFPKMRDLILDLLPNSRRYCVSTNSKGVSQMHAVLFINEEEDNKVNAMKLKQALMTRCFDVQLLANWTAQTLCQQIQKCIITDICSLLFVCGMTHGHEGYLLEPYAHMPKYSESRILEHSIKISDITQAIQNMLPQNTPKIVIFDACQTKLEDVTDTKTVDSQRGDEEDTDKRRQPIVLITCLPDQEAWGNVFIKPLVEELESGKDDVYEIIDNAINKMREYTKQKNKELETDAKLKEERKEQDVNFFSNLRPGDIVLPSTTSVSQSNEDDQDVI